MTDQPFWRRKALADMTRDEWESLCDGCGRCCLIKLEDADNGDIFYTDVTCRLLDHGSCRCTSYALRSTLVPDCVSLDPANVHELGWMPSTCAYRLLAEGKDLPPWHPLVTGNPDSVHDAGISVRGKVLSEEGVAEDDLVERMVDWPA